MSSPQSTKSSLIRWSLSAFNIAIVVSAVLVTASAVTFFVGSTAYVSFWFGLSDPSVGLQTVGRYLGAFILAALALSLGWLAFLFDKFVARELPHFQSVANTWSNIAVKRASDNPTALGDKSPEWSATERDDALRKLSEVAAGTGRLRAVLQSWQHPTPNSDAEYVIEGAAASCRQQLGVLQTIASVLVLVGLVGNFFGLSEAVKEFPEITRTQSQVSGPAKTVKKETLTPPAKDKVLAEVKSESVVNDAPPPLNQRATEQALDGIANSLQVVVISSVLGIGAMAVLLFFVAVAKAIFNALVAKEIVLMSAEVGSVLRPREGGGGGTGLPSPVQSAFESLSLQLGGFANAATNLSAHSSSFKAVATSLEKIVEQQLKTSTSYQESLDRFTTVMEHDRETVIQLANSTSKLAGKLGDIAEHVKSVAAKSETVSERFSGIQLHYETYLQAAQDEMRQNRDVMAKTHELLCQGEDLRRQGQLQAIADSVAGISDRVGDSLKDLFSEVRTDLREGLTDLREELISELAQRHNKELEALDAVTTTQHQVVSSVLAGQSSGEKALATSNQSLEAAKQAIEQSRDRMAQIHDLVSHQQEIALRELVSDWRAQMEEQGQRTQEQVAKLNRQLAEHSGVAKEQLESWREHLAEQSRVSQAQVDIWKGQMEEQSRRSLEQVAKSGSALGQQVERMPEFLAELEQVKTGLGSLASELRSYRQAKSEEQSRAEENRASIEEKFRRELGTKLETCLKPVADAAARNDEMASVTAQALQEILKQFQTQVDWSKVEPRARSVKAERKTKSTMDRLRGFFGKGSK